MHVIAGMSVPVDRCVINIATVFYGERLCPFISRASVTLPRVSDMARPASCGDFLMQWRVKSNAKDGIDAPPDFASFSRSEA